MVTVTEPNLEVVAKTTFATHGPDWVVTVRGDS